MRVTNDKVNSFAVYCVCGTSSCPCKPFLLEEVSRMNEEAPIPLDGSLTNQHCDRSLEASRSRQYINLLFFK